MQTLTELEAEQVRGGGLGPINIAPSITVNTGLIGVLQLNNGANVATSIGGSASAILAQADLATVMS